MIRELGKYTVAFSELVDYLESRDILLKTFATSNVRIQYVLVCEYLINKHGYTNITTTHNYMWYSDILKINENDHRNFDSRIHQEFELLCEGLINNKEYITGECYAKILKSIFEYMQNHNF